jgi:hypothetical protein
MDRKVPDIVGNQTNFINTIVKPCYEALSREGFIIENDSLIKTQLEQNLAIWEETTVDEDGQFNIPDILCIKKRIAQKLYESKTISEISGKILYSSKKIHFGA